MDLPYKKKIVYVINYAYLSYPLYESLVEILGDSYEHILLILEDPFIDQDLSGLDGARFNRVHLVQFSDHYWLKGIIANKKYIHKVPLLLRLFYNYKKAILSEIDIIKPNLVLSTTDMTFGMKVISDFVQQFDCKTGIYQPSFIDSVPRNGFSGFRNWLLYWIFNRFFRLPIFDKQQTWGNEIPGAIKFLWGDKFSGYLKNQKEIRVVGNPMLKRYYNSKSEIDSELKEVLGIESDRPIITICSEAFKGTVDDNKVFDIYKQTIKILPGYYFIIKVHPRDDLRFYQKFFEDSSSNNICVIKDVSIIGVLNISDVQISVNSYSSVEAIILNVPVILVNREIVSLPNHFSEHVILEAKNSVELAEQIKKALSVNYRALFEINRSLYLKEVFGATDIEQIEHQVRINIEELIYKIV